MGGYFSRESMCVYCKDPVDINQSIKCEFCNSYIHFDCQAKTQSLFYCYACEERLPEKPSDEQA